MYTLVSIGTAVTSVLMLVALLRPLLMLRLYFILRPILTPFTFWKYTLFGTMPIGTPYLAIMSAGGFLASFGSGKRLCPPGLLFMYFYLFISLPSMLITPSLMAAATLQTKVTVAISAYLIAYNYTNSRKALTYMLFSIVLFSAIAPFAYGAYQYVTGTANAFTPYWSPTRITSVFALSNAYGEYLNIVILLLIGMLLSSYYKKQRKLLLILLAIAGVESLLSQNRGAWIGLVAGLLAAMVIYRRVLPIKWVLIGGLVVSIFGGAFIMARFEMLSQVGQWGNSQNTFSGRLDYVADLLSLAFENPFIGKGVGYAYELPGLPHNDFMWIFLENGIFAVLAYIFFHLFNILTHIKNRNTENWRCLQFSFCAISIYFFIHSWLQNIFSNPSIFPFFMACFGMAAKLMVLKDTGEES